MDPFETQLKNAAREITLTDAERDLTRDRVHAYMAMKPLARDLGAPRTSWTDVFHVFQTRALPAALGVLLVLSGSGVSFAAESAMPGDFLYPVKLHVNEEFIDALQLSPSARLAWAAERAERRLDEATLLASRGELTAELQAEVAANFERQAEDVTARTEALEGTDPASAAEVATDFEASLEAHEMIFARVAAETETESGVRKLAEQVRTAAKQVAALRLEAEEELLADAGAQGFATLKTTSSEEVSESANVRQAVVERLRGSAVARLSEAEAALASLAGTERQGLYTEAEVQLAAAQGLFAKGEEAVAQGDYSTAYTAFRDSASQARRIAQLLEAEKIFSISILPISLTGSATSTNEIEFGEDATVREQMTANAHTRATERIAETQQALLVTPDASPRAQELLKEAQVFVIRGEIALVTDDVEDALRFFRSAQSRAEAALELIGPEATDQEKPKEAQEKPSTDTTAPIGPNDTVIYHEYEDGTHVFSGTFIVPTPCHSLAATAEVAKSLPEQVRILLRIEGPQNGMLCTQVLDEKGFSLSVEATEKARLLGVEANDVELEFVVVEGVASSSTGTDPILPVTEDGTASNTDDTATRTSSIGDALNAGRAFLKSLR